MSKSETYPLNFLNWKRNYALQQPSGLCEAVINFLDRCSVMIGGLMEELVLCGFNTTILLCNRLSVI